MSNGVTYPNPIEGYFAEKDLGQRGRCDTISPDAHECDIISELLRKGVRNGVGSVRWELRTEPGVRIDQSAMNAIADCVYEAQTSGNVPSVDDGGLPGPDTGWRVSVRR